MPIYKLEELNYVQLQELDKKYSVFFLTISPLEEHAPFLPLGTDVFNASYFAQATAEDLVQNKPDWNVVLIPPLYLGTYVFKFVGSVRHRQKVILEVIKDYGKSIANWGFDKIIIFSAHGGAGHISVLEEAARKVSKRYKIRMISLSGKIATDLLLGQYVDKIQANLQRPLDQKEQEILKYDYHAGWWETSMMLKLRPDLVKESYKEFPPVLIENPLQLKSDAALKLGKGLGYFGTPSFADKKLAEASFKVLKEEGMKIIYRFLAGEDVTAETTSLAYKSLIFRTNFRRNFLILSLLVLALLIYAILRFLL